MISLLKTILYEPLYNIFVFITSISPIIDAGIAIITLTFLVRLVIFPLSKKAIITQKKIQLYQDELNEIKEKYKEDKQKQAEKMLNFYKEKEINPFSTIFLLLVQMPVIISLYLIFLHAQLPDIRTDLLYDFVPQPEEISMFFLGIYDISGSSILFALLAGVTSFVQLRLSMPPVQEKKNNPSIKDELARNMNIQMRYFFPFIITGIAYFLSAVVALYLITSNIFTIFQELSLKKDKLRFKEEADKKKNKKESDEKKDNKKEIDEKENSEVKEEKSRNNNKKYKGKKKKKYGRRKR